jgi:oxygen-dependent protoporphyrinogen oxidase
VLGGGFSGLLSAWHLARGGWKVDLVEGSDRLGGLISTAKLEHGIAESAAHSFLASSDVRELCAQLNVPLLQVRKNSRARYIIRNGAPDRLPLRWFEMLELGLSLVGERADGEHSSSNSSLTLEKWSRYFLGDPALEYLVNPMVRGIYAARPSELSVSAAFPKIQVDEGSSLLGSLFAQKGQAKGKSSGKSGMVVPASGMQGMIDAFVTELRASPNVTLRTGMRVSSLEAVSAPNLITTLPAYALSRVLAVDGHEEEASACARVSYAPLMSVTAILKKDAFSRVPCGVGTLVPELEEGNGWKCLGVLYTSSSFVGRVKDEARHVSCTLMFGSTAHPEYLAWSDEEVEAEVISTLARLHGLRGGSEALEDLRIHRWGQAIPVYNSDLQNAWTTLSNGYFSRPGRLAFGNWTGQVSIRGMIESWARCLASGS